VAFLGIKDLVSTFITRWELPVGIMTIIVCFWFSKGVWGFLNEKFGGRKNISH
jgi:hypothetical protein